MSSVSSFISVLASSTFRGYNVVVSPEILEKLAIVEKDIEYWDFDPSSEDLNFYNGSDVLILASIVEFDDGRVYILPCREE